MHHHTHVSLSNLLRRADSVSVGPAPACQNSHNAMVNQINNDPESFLLQWTNLRSPPYCSCTLFISECVMLNLDYSVLNGLAANWDPSINWPEKFASRMQQANMHTPSLYVLIRFPLSCCCMLGSQIFITSTVWNASFSTPGIATPRDRCSVGCTKCLYLSRTTSEYRHR